MKKPEKIKVNKEKEKDATFHYLVESLKEIRDNWNGNTTKDFHLRKEIIDKALENIKDEDDKD